MSDQQRALAGELHTIAKAALLGLAYVCLSICVSVYISLWGFVYALGGFSVCTCVSVALVMCAPLLDDTCTAEVHVHDVKTVRSKQVGCCNVVRSIAAAPVCLYPFQLLMCNADEGEQQGST